jgi:hypothetical protein
MAPTHLHGSIKGLKFLSGDCLGIVVNPLSLLQIDGFFGQLALLRKSVNGPS